MGGGLFLKNLVALRTENGLKPVQDFYFLLFYFSNGFKQTDIKKIFVECEEY